MYRTRSELARYGAPATFLLLITVVVLIIHSSRLRESTPAATTRIEQTTQSTTTKRPTPPRFYRVQSGDTLGAIAARFDTTVERLLVINPGVEPTALRVGQRIQISGQVKPG